MLSSVLLSFCSLSLNPRYLSLFGLHVSIKADTWCCFYFSAQMSSFSTRALTLLSSVFGACGLLLVGVAVSTDYWLLMEEGIILQQNQTTEVKMALHSGLWRVCFVAGWYWCRAWCVFFPVMYSILIQFQQMRHIFLHINGNLMPVFIILIFPSHHLLLI